MKKVKLKSNRRNKFKTREAAETRQEQPDVRELDVSHACGRESSGAKMCAGGVRQDSASVAGTLPSVGDTSALEGLGARTRNSIVLQSDSEVTATRHAIQQENATKPKTPTTPTTPKLQALGVKGTFSTVLLCGPLWPTYITFK